MLPKDKKGLYLGAIGVGAVVCISAFVFIKSSNDTKNEYDSATETIVDGEEKVTLDFTDKTAMNMRDYYTKEGEEFIKKILPDSTASDFALLNVGKTLDNELKDIVFTTVDNTEIKLADLKGKKVVIDFAMTSCGTCQGELSFMSHYDYKSKGIEYIHVFPLDATSAVKNAYDGYDGKYDKSHIVSQTGLNGFTIEDLSITNVPAKIFIDENGVVQYAFVGGFNDEETMELHLERAFDESVPKILSFLKTTSEYNQGSTDSDDTETEIIEIEESDEELSEETAE
jgi:thiol-disulfide isomerase/thioredoxin